MTTAIAEHRKGTAVLRYSNPPRDYLTAPGSAELLDAVEAAVADAAVRAIILTGRDEAFIRHYDVGEIEAVRGAVTSGSIGREAMETGPFAALTRAVFEAPKPVIAAINGVCMGGGFELALACDFRVAQRDVAMIGLPETRIGIAPGGGGTQRLPRLIGEARALEFILRGQVVAAAEAREMGLVHQLADDALADAVSLAEELATRSPESLAMAKQLVRTALATPLEEGLRAEQHGFFDLLSTEGAAQGIQSFFANGEDIAE
ncbi:MAG: enoyl-CoA hydratase/isomerase family protein [Pseudomonadota bacterium]